MYIIIWILWFLILIILHELWHFIASRMCWVKVYEFWLWIPPKIKTLYKDKKWTEYTLNALPLWWFIRPKWEDLSKDSEIYDKDSFHSKPVWQKFIILSAWVIMNLIIAFVIFVLAFWHGIKPIIVIPDSSNNFTAESYLFPTTSFAKKVWYITWNTTKQLKVEWILKTKKTLSSQIDIQTWDIIKTINLKNIDTSNVGIILKKNIWKKVNIWILRKNKKIHFTAKCPEDSCLLWIYFNSDRKIQADKMNFTESIFWSLHEIKAQTILTFEWLWLLYHKLTHWQVKQAMQKLSWPVGAVAIWKYILKIWIWEYIAFIWAISFALAIFNILPIPALDGWRILTTAIMHLFKLNPKKYLVIENYITIFFFAILMIIWVYIMYLDYIRFY